MEFDWIKFTLINWNSKEKSDKLYSSCMSKVVNFMVV